MKNNYVKFVLIIFGLLVIFSAINLNISKVKASSYSISPGASYNTMVCNANGICSGCTGPFGAFLCYFGADYSYNLGTKGVDFTQVILNSYGWDDEGSFQVNGAPLVSGQHGPYSGGDVTGYFTSGINSIHMYAHDLSGGMVGGSASFTIIKPDLQSLSISPATSTLTSGQTQQFTATATYSDSTTKNVSSSSTWGAAANIGTINNTSSKGLFTASAVSIQTGQVSASYTESGVTKTATANVIVNPAESILIKVTATDPINPASPGVPKGQTARYNVAVTSFGFAGNITLNISKKTYFDNNTANNTTPDDWFDIKFNDIPNSTTVSVPKGGTANVPMTITSTNNARTDIQGIYSFFVNGTNGASITGGTWAFLKVLEGVAVGVSATGDIYSGKNIGNLSIGAKSVLAAQTIIPADNSQYWKISPYTYSKLALMQNTMNKNIKRLENENSVKINPPSADIGFWYLNNNSTISPKDFGDGKYPEGKVWVVNGDLTLNTTKFYGKGTIIVENTSGGLGTVNINGDLTYDDTGTNSLGIIAKTINIAPGVNVVRGAFYASEAINIQ